MGLRDEALKAMDDGVQRINIGVVRPDLYRAALDGLLDWLAADEHRSVGAEGHHLHDLAIDEVIDLLRGGVDDE